MKLINTYETRPGWSELRFGFDRAVIDALKQVPGLRWVPTKKCWEAPTSALPVISDVLGGLATMTPGLKTHTTQYPGVDPRFTQNLRPYQTEGVAFMLAREGALLGFGMRVGKTRTASAAAAAAMTAVSSTGVPCVSTVLVLYPNTVRDEWATQFKDQTQGLPMTTLTGTALWTPEEFEALRIAQHLALGLHYELIREKGDPSKEGKMSQLKRLLELRGRFALIADEAHFLKNRKAGRTKYVLQLARSPKCAYRWALSGTPMRNYPRDMWALFDFIQPDSMGSYSKFTTRYAGGHQGPYGWLDDGTTNYQELSARLAAVMLRRTRQDVAQWLPAGDRKVVLCDMNAADLKLYKKQEAALGQAALASMKEGSSAQSLVALKQLASLTVAPKLDVMLDRLQEHLQVRKVKVIVFANFHESLNSAISKYLPLITKGSPPAFVAGGWLDMPKRKKAIEAWKAHAGPAVLFANMISSGIGIDLSDADTALFVELTWVPADFQQAEARIEDVHLGKRTTPPLYEYLLTRGTIDEDMGYKLLSKLRANAKVVGNDRDSTQLSGSLENSGLVDRNQLELSSEDDSVVDAVLDGLRARLFGDDTPNSADITDTGDNADAPDTEEDVEEADDDDNEA